MRFDLSRGIKHLVDYDLDYFRVGPFISQDSYDENLSGYTLGHGGYFSPARFTSIGANTELLTPEGKDWQVRTAISVSYTQIEQDDY